jgi:hypothetical protein
VDTSWVIWALVLVLQNAAHTVTSRARNSDNLRYSSIASVASNGIWIISNLFMVGNIVAAQTVPEKVALVIFYVICTVAGATGAHWYAIKLERRKRSGS